MYLRSQYIVKNSWATSQTPLTDFIVSVLKQTTLIAIRTWPRRDETIRKSEQNQGLCPTETIFWLGQRRKNI